MNPVRIVTLAFLTVATLAVVPNIGGMWLGEFGNPQNTKYVPIRLGFWTGAQYAADIYSFGYGPGHTVAPADGTAYTPTYGKVTHWNMSSPTNSTPLKTFVFVGQAEMSQMQLLPFCRGQMLATVIGNQANASPANRTLFGLHLNLSAQTWSYPLGNSTSVVTSASDCVVFLAGCSNSVCWLTALDARIGTQLWAARLAAADSVTSVAVSTTGGAVFVKTHNSVNSTTAVSCFSAEAELLWERSFSDAAPSRLPIAYNHGTKAVVTVVGESELLAMEAMTGELRWRMPFITGDAPFAPAVDSDCVYLALNATVITRISLIDGAIKTRYGPGKYQNDVLVVDDAVVVQQSQAGQVQVQISGKNSGDLVMAIPTPAGYFNKRLGVAGGWIWAWSGETGHGLSMLQFY